MIQRQKKGVYKKILTENQLQSNKVHVRLHLLRCVSSVYHQSIRRAQHTLAYPCCWSTGKSRRPANPAKSRKSRGITFCQLDRIDFLSVYIHSTPLVCIDFCTQLSFHTTRSVNTDLSFYESDCVHSTVRRSISVQLQPMSNQLLATFPAKFQLISAKFLSKSRAVVPLPPYPSWGGGSGRKRNDATRRRFRWLSVTLHCTYRKPSVRPWRRVLHALLGNIGYNTKHF